MKSMMRIPAWVIAAMTVTTIGACEPAIDGNGIRGGLLYDKWWAVTGDAEPTTDNPLWATRPDTESNTRTGPDTWRCKECHGWDYIGLDGRYSSGSHYTGFDGVLDTTMSASQIKDLVADSEGHAFVDLEDQDLSDLAVFVTEYLVSIDTYMGGDGSFTGDATAGEAHYTTACADCHGADGLDDEPAGSDGGFEDFPGLIANDNPQEFIHKVRFGQPGTAMPPQADVLDDAQLADLSAFAQGLPQAAPK